MAKFKQVHINLDEEDHYKMKIFAAKNRSTMQSLIESLVKEYIEQSTMTPEKWANHRLEKEK